MAQFPRSAVDLRFVYQVVIDAVGEHVGIEKENVAALSGIEFAIGAGGNFLLHGKYVLEAAVALVIPTGNPTGLYPTKHVYRSEEPTSELQSLMRISYAVFC